jgi:hypothetical protein
VLKHNVRPVADATVERSIWALTGVKDNGPTFGCCGTRSRCFVTATICIG